MGPTVTCRAIAARHAWEHRDRELLYLVQEVARSAPRVDSRLYTYGPFASEVLDDSETAQSFQASASKPFSIPLATAMR